MSQNNRHQALKGSTENYLGRSGELVRVESTWLIRLQYLLGQRASLHQATFPTSQSRSYIDPIS